MRVRTGGERRSAPPAAGAGAEPAATMREDGAVYLRGLARSQFRLALGTLLAFLVVILAFTAVLSLLPEWGDPVILGVPLSWLLQAYGYYPIIAVFAIAYVRGAHANERRYRELVSGPSSGTERR
ncbi:heavy metal transporter [Leucobacter weissii]|uniref:Heavy metal transporter n=1 Tax=Leucobacter weissii TaxID=1983706 RepID=A0A939S8R6_9MICO|nr:heavy metal transporter [Leucobacter weissii]